MRLCSPGGTADWRCLFFVYFCVGLRATFAFCLRQVTLTYSFYVRAGVWTFPIASTSPTRKRLYSRAEKTGSVFRNAGIYTRLRFGLVSVF